MRPKPIKALTGLRIVGAFAVFLDHWQILRQGAVGVSLFFCLSGFVLAYNYGGAFPDLQWQRVKSFLAARIARIGPMHWTGMLLVVLYGLWRNGSWVVHSGRLLLSILLLQSFSHNPSVYFSFNGVAWSMSDEMVFYLLFPFLLFGFLAKCSRLQLKRLLLAGLILSIGLPLGLAHSGLSHGEVLYYSYIFPPTRLIEFVSGSCLGLLEWHGRKTGTRGFARKGLWQKPDLSALIGFGLILATAVAVQQFAPGQDVRWYTLWYLPAFAFAIWALATPSSGFVSRLFGHPTVVLLGQMSFSFYVLHQVVRRYWSLVHVPVPAVVAVFVLSLATSYVTFHWYENPLRRAMKQAAVGLWPQPQQRSAIVSDGAVKRQLSR